MDLPDQLNAAGKSATKKLLGRLLATGIAEIDDIIGGSQRWELCDIAASTGSACSSEHQDPNYVLMALGVARYLAYNAVRFGLGRFNTEEEVEYRETIADGARTMSLGRHNWAVLQNALAGIVEVSEEFIKEGLRLLFGLANLKVEPTGALSIGALLSEPDKFKGKTVCCVISGGNVDPEVYRRLLA